MTAEELIAFEAEVAVAFNSGHVRAPVHLSAGNERELIAYFSRHHRPGDWVCTYWRSHYHALLAGVPRAEVLTAVLAGRSITLCFPEYRVVSSAIVGGILPIALGLALGIKRSQSGECVHCFVGDMTARTGTYSECLRYARGHRLPVRFVVEDNGKSVMTDTRAAWGRGSSNPEVYESSYEYALTWPHAGAGKRIDF